MLPVFFDGHPRLVPEDGPMLGIFRSSGVFVLLLPLLCESASAGSHKIRMNQFDTSKQTAVVMINGSLDPEVLKVKQGTTVEWINNGEGQSVAAKDESFKSGVLKPGANFQHTFSKPGKYMYRCLLYTGEDASRKAEGTIIVTK